MLDKNIKTILLVEDEVLIAMSEETSLKEYGYNVIISNTGEEALEEFRNNTSIDLILMDVDLGAGIDGPETAIMMLAIRTIPVVFLSSHTEPDIVAKTEKITSYGYVVKNSGITVLDASIKMAFRLFEANKQIAESENKQKAMISNISDVIGIIGADGIMKYKSPNIEKLFGWKPEDLVGTNGFITVHPDDLERIQHVFYTLLEQYDRSQTIEYRYKCKDGSYRPVELTAVNCINNPAIEGILLNYKDITERKHSEEELARSNRLLEAVIMQSPFAIHVLKGDFNNIHVVIENNESKRIMGETIEGRENIDADNPETLSSRFFTPDGSKEILLSDMPGPGAFRGKNIANEEILFRHPDGTEIFVEASASPVYDQTNHIIAIVVTSQDITERKHAEETLRKSEERYIKAQRIGHVGNWEYNLQTARFWGSDEAKRIYGFDPEKTDFSTEEVESCILERERVHQALVDLIREGKEYNLEFEIHPKDKSAPRIIWSVAEMQRDDNGDPQLITGVVQDITKQKQAEIALRESELKYRSLIENSNDVVFCVNEKGEYQFANKTFASTFGKTPDYFIGKTFWDIYPKEHADHRQAASKKVFETGEPQSVEVTVPLPDRTLYYLAKANPIKDETGRVFLNLTTATDITDRKVAEDKIKSLLSEKELILKEVHHRIKNNMNTLISLLSLQAGAAKEPAVTTALEDAGSRVKSMLVLYDQLHQSASFQELPVNEYLPALIIQIVGNFPNSGSVRIEHRIDKFILDSKILSTIGMILNELLTNIMKYAFSGRNDGLIAVSAARTGNHISLVIRDNGTGMPESVDFENSTGFGLMLVKVLTQQLNGSIHIDRTEGTGITLEFDVQ